MIDYVSIESRGVQAHLESVQQQARALERLQDALWSYYEQEQLNPIGQPELVHHEFKCAQKLLNRVKRRQEILEEMLEDFHVLQQGNREALDEMNQLMRATGSEEA